MNSKLTIKLKRFDKSLPLPEYKTSGAAAFDLAARLTTKVSPHTVAYIPLNIALQLPANYWALMAARSSLHKKGLTMANGIGIGDTDFCGDQDEYQAAVYNFTDQEVIVKKGERVVQMLILPREKVQIVEAISFGTANRGGFGSTGS